MLIIKNQGLTLMQKSWVLDKDYYQYPNLFQDLILYIFRNNKYILNSSV